MGNENTDVRRLVSLYLPLGPNNIFENEADVLAWGWYFSTFFGSRA